MAWILAVSVRVLYYRFFKETEIEIVLNFVFLKISIFLKKVYNLLSASWRKAGGVVQSNPKALDLGEVMV